jgi:hypothetical protein
MTYTEMFEISAFLFGLAFAAYHKGRLDGLTKDGVPIIRRYQGIIATIRDRARN